MKWEEAGRGCSLGRHRKRPRPTHIPYSSADGKRCTTSGRRALQTHGESPGQSIHTRLRAAGGNPAGGSDLTSFLFPSRIPSAPDCRTSRAPAPAHNRSGGERQGPSPAPAPPAAGVRAAASPEAPERPAASPRPAPGQEAPLPRPLHPPPRSPCALSPQGVRTTRRRAWAPWCRHHRRLPLSPASRRLAMQ